MAESCTSLETLIVPVLPDSGSTLYRIEPRRRGCAGRVRSDEIINPAIDTKMKTHYVRLTERCRYWKKSTSVRFDYYY